MSLKQLLQTMKTREWWVKNKTNQMEQMFMQKTKREDREFFISSLVEEWENRGK